MKIGEPLYSGQNQVFPIFSGDVEVARINVSTDRAMLSYRSVDQNKITHIPHKSFDEALNTIYRNFYENLWEVRITSADIVEHGDREDRLYAMLKPGSIFPDFETAVQAAVNGCQEIVDQLNEDPDYDFPDVTREELNLDQLEEDTNIIVGRLQVPALFVSISMTNPSLPG